MSTINRVETLRWYRVVVVLLSAALTVATGVAIYFAVSEPAEVAPRVVPVTVLPSEPPGDCHARLVPC
ncbi:hypothetical protein [Amycolatopsis sp. NPDC051371]|uniref:hypothetical protein n=1 Tax=Amycolatopsis sp. NPDC051371 TaxID=3155800 RepID=UPI0034199CE3